MLGDSPWGGALADEELAVTRCGVAGAGVQGAGAKGAEASAIAAVRKRGIKTQEETGADQKFSSGNLAGMNGLDATGSMGGKKESKLGTDGRRLEADEVRYIPIEKLAPSATNPRKHFAAEKLAELEDSIREHGFTISVMLVRPCGWVSW